MPTNLPDDFKGTKQELPDGPAARVGYAAAGLVFLALAGVVTSGLLWLIVYILRNLPT